MSAGNGASAGDGRNIDVRVGTLSGEGSQQRVPADRPGSDGAPHFAVWDKSPYERDGRATYYDRPVVKEPVWIWTVPAYFWAGGAAGAAAVLAETVRLAGGDELRGLAGRARWIAGVCAPLGVGLLVADLGRPERFLNMMRVFRRTSPMSVGSWILGTAAPASAAAALFETRSNGLPSILGRATGLVSGLLGAPLAGYTGVLIANTAVPIWQAGRRSLPGLFMASGVSSAGSLLQLTGGGDAERQTARLFAAAGQAGELVGGAAFEREAGGVATVAKPLHEGLSGTLWKATKALTASALALNVVPGRSRLKGLAAGALGTLGALSLRFAVFHAGKSSARDPRATFDNQRSGRGAAEVTGTAAVTGAGGRRAT